MFFCYTELKGGVTENHRGNKYRMVVLQKIKLCGSLPKNRDKLWLLWFLLCVTKNITSLFISLFLSLLSPIRNSPPPLPWFSSRYLSASFGWIFSLAKVLFFWHINFKKSLLSRICFPSQFFGMWQLLKFWFLFISFLNWKHQKIIIILKSVLLK